MNTNDDEKQYIWIVNWESFQHYGTRDPIWIKNYTRLLAKDEYLGLSSHQRAVLHGLWLTFASARRQLLLTTSSLSSRLGLRVMSRDIEALNHAGFIEIIASAVLAERLQDASLEVEVEVDSNPKAVEKGRSGPNGLKARDSFNKKLRGTQ